MNGYTPLILREIREESKDFKTFIFAQGHNLKYQAGQFVTLIDTSGSKEIRRSYSITSSPDLNEPLSIAVKRIDNGFFSRKMVDHVRVGDKLLTSGAAGFFRLPDNLYSFTHVFFFAAGSGIAPILPLIKTILHLYPDIRVHLIYSNRSIKTAAFRDELINLQVKYPFQFQAVFLFSSEADLRKARLNRELLLELLQTNRLDKSKTLFYTCGPESYMRMIIFLLIEEGYPKEHIKKEDFNPGNKKITARRPPDTNSHEVHLLFQGRHYDFSVVYPDSILRAAKKLNLNLPYSCETGKCGSCAAHCISGKVWLSNNDVLTEKELAQHLTLTCTGYPQYGDVTLEIV